MGDCACAAAPDYTPVVKASKESSDLMTALGYAQLDESRRQADITREASAPVIERQVKMMDQSIAQGDDYASFMKEYGRPNDIALAKEAATAGSPEAQQAAADRAIADSQGGYTRSVNQALRASRRYGLNAAAPVGEQVLTQASTTAGLATGARDKEKQLGYAKKMDMASISHGLAGLSQGAYSTAMNAGNASVANSTIAGNQQMQGMSGAIGTIGQGQQMRSQGLTDVMKTQGAMGSGAYDDGTAQLAGTAIMAAAMIWSDRRLKRDIRRIGTSKAGHALYAYRYLWRDDIHIGVMADEVSNVPGAIVSAGGFNMVNYACLH